MGFSNLVNGVTLADSSNYTNGRKGYKVCKFTPHHMAGRLSAERCCQLFQNPGRNASANYCIGVDGELYGCVDENNRAWTSSSSWNDCQAITVEVANSSTGGNWPISEASWNTLVNLAEDVCRRYGFRLEYNGTKDGSLTCHEMFANTNCPGPYLKSRLNELIEIVNERLDGKQPSPAPAPQPTPSEEGYQVQVTADCLNIRKGPSTNYSITGQIKDKGIYTIVEEQGNWGRLKSGAGWICLNYTSKGESSTPTSAPAPQPKYSLGLYTVTAASGLNVRKGPGTNYEVVKTYKNGTRFDTYEIQGDWARTPSGWVNLNYCKLTREY